MSRMLGTLCIALTAAGLDSTVTTLVSEASKFFVWADLPGCRTGPLAQPDANRAPVPVRDACCRVWKPARQADT